MDTKVKYIIYGLIDPITRQIRYIGKSTSGLTRPKNHGRPGHLKRDKTYKGNWIRKLQSQGLNYDILILQTLSSPSLLSQAEIIWIRYFRNTGVPLTNSTNGGEGVLGRVKSESEKARIGVRGEKHHAYGKPGFNRGKKASEETRTKQSKAKKGKPSPHIGKIYPPEVRAKMSKSSHSAKLSESQVRAIKNSNKDYEQLSKEYNVSKSTIYLIQSSRIWKWIV